MRVVPALLLAPTSVLPRLLSSLLLSPSRLAGEAFGSRMVFLPPSLLPRLLSLPLREHLRPGPCISRSGFGDSTPIGFDPTAIRLGTIPLTLRLEAISILFPAAIILPMVVLPVIVSVVVASMSLRKCLAGDHRGYECQGQGERR